MPYPRASKQSFVTNRPLTNKCTLKMIFVIFLSLTPNISASRQNFKNLVNDLRDIKMRNLFAKFELCSFNTEGKDEGGQCSCS